MNTTDQDIELFANWSEYIKDNQVRSAFWYLIGVAACLRRFECKICCKGEVRDFRFFDSSGEQSFSFITNQKWLLFYFRLPVVRSSSYSKDRISSLFKSSSENPAGERTIKLTSGTDVDCL